MSFSLSAVVSDYTEVSISLGFTQLNADQPQCINIPITNDNVLESIETFSVELITSEPGVVLLSPSSAVISILDDDGMMSYTMTIHASYIYK